MTKKLILIITLLCFLPVTNYTMLLENKIKQFPYKTVLQKGINKHKKRLEKHSSKNQQNRNKKREPRKYLSPNENERIKSIVKSYSPINKKGKIDCTFCDAISY